MNSWGALTNKIRVRSYLLTHPAYCQKIYMPQKLTHKIDYAELNQFLERSDRILA